MFFLNRALPPVIRRFLFIMPVMIAGFGIQMLYVYFTNPRPIEVSIEQLITNPPRAKWVRVTGGEITLIDALISERGFKKTIDKVYLPVHPEGKEDSEVAVLLLSTDPEILALARQFHGLEKATDGDMEGLRLIVKNTHVIFQKRSFEGLIQSGLSQDDRTTFQIRKMLPNIVDEPIIIEEGKKPTIVEGLMLLLVAFLMTVGIRSVPKAKNATPPPLPPRPPRLPLDALRER